MSETSVVDGYEMTESHSEAEIYRDLIPTELMQEIGEKCYSYFDCIGSDPKQIDDEFLSEMRELQHLDIVERFFLFGMDLGMNHSCGTSLGLKCDELSIDTGNAVVCEDNRGKENE